MSNFLRPIISNFLFEHVVFPMRYIIFWPWEDKGNGAKNLPRWGGEDPAKAPLWSHSYSHQGEQPMGE